MSADNGGGNGGNERGAIGSDKDVGGNKRAPFVGREFVIEPASIPGATGTTGTADSGATGTTGTGAKRGRKPGSKNATGSEKTSTLNKDGLRDLILFAHTILENATHIPEFKMDTAEAESVAVASANVLRHYDIGQQSQKAIDWVALIFALMAVYGTRAMAYRARVSPKKQSPNLRTVS